LDEDRDNLLERIRAEEVQRLGREIGQTTYRTLMWISIPVALFIGGIGAVSVFKAAYRPAGIQVRLRWQKPPNFPFPDAQLRHSAHCESGWLSAPIGTMNH
jgi:hypothetical protein